MSRPHTPPIAIIGMAAILPHAKDLREYWQNILNQSDCIIDVPPSRWSIADHYDPDPNVPDKSYCKRGGFIPEIDFDPLEFGLPPNILEVTDTSQLLGLFVAKKALEDAGYGHRPFDNEHTGVILGATSGQKLTHPLSARLQTPVWEKVLRSTGMPEPQIQQIIEKVNLAYVPWEESSFPGFLGNVIAGRITNRLNLGGTNCVVDAACASSLAALKMAISELAEGRCNMMLTGGVDTDNSIFMYLCFSKTPAFSSSEVPKPFDENADGMMVGEGIGMLVLKRLADAERDGDRIYAVIRGIGTSSDGRSKSIYAPHAEGQAKALRRAYEDAGFSPTTVGLIEAHGTGTMAGDKSEFEALKRVFSENNPRKGYIALGSVKSQIGHTKAAAGASSLIKTALALHHKVLVSTLNVTKPNPKFGIPDSPFYINTEVQPWIQAKGGLPRRAGVSSFGFGGTNFHVVLEEYVSEHPGAYRINQAPQAVLLVAATPQALAHRCTEVAAALQTATANQAYAELVAATASLTIPEQAARLGFVAHSLAEAVDLLQISLAQLTKNLQEEAWQHPKGIFYRRTGLAPKGKVVALFAGQGSQYVNMGRELALNFPALREVFGALDERFQAENLPSLAKTVFPTPALETAQSAAQSAALQRTDYAQPAIGAISAGMYKILQQAGFQPDFTLGHSFGELTALWAAGVLEDQAYFTLIKARGKAMAPPPHQPDFDAGSMLAVSGNLQNLQADLQAFPQITLANLNAPNQIVIAGPKAALAAAQPALTAKGYNVVNLPVAAAFHTPLVGHAQRPFAQTIQQVAFQSPKLPVYANATAKPYPTEPQAIQELLAQQILQPVQFQKAIETIYQAGGSIFVEFGPRNILSLLVKSILGSKPHVTIALNPSRQKDSDYQLREAVVQLQVIGLPLQAFDPYYLNEPTVQSANKPRRLSVSLNGSNFVSEKRQQAFEDAIKPGQTVAYAQPVAPLPVPAQTLAVVAPVPQTQMPQPQVVSQNFGDVLERGLAQLSEQQRDSQRIHEQHLGYQTEFLKTFFHLMQQQQTLIQQGAAPSVVETLSRNLLALQEQQLEGLRVHQRHVEGQADFSKMFFQVLQQQYSLTNGGNAERSVALNPMVNLVPMPSVPMALPPPPVPTFVPAPAPVVTPSLRQAQGTPPPAPVVMPPPVPTFVAAPAPVVTPSLRQAQGTPAPAPVVTPPPAPTFVPVPVPSPEPLIVATVVSPVVSNVQNDKIQIALLQVVSEKTGYPVEMLEPEMDMEADLGIDSIKRVEILGALQDLFPNLPKFKPDELAELRTLAQIMQHMQQSQSPIASPAPVSLPPAAPVPVVSSANSDALQESLLQVVSDKTGYPVEMLEPEMDMEADLGIDSIKRVEILGALQDLFPSLPKFKPDELAELRSLAQIIQHMRGVVVGS